MATDSTLAQSTGHIVFGGPFEFYELGGEVYRAPKDAPINDCIRGIRSGRWECSRLHFDTYRDVIVPQDA